MVHMEQSHLIEMKPKRLNVGLCRRPASPPRVSDHGRGLPYRGV